MEQLATLTNSCDPPPPPPRRDWGAIADGGFHLCRDQPDENESRIDSRRAYDRLRLSATQWAARRGGTSETRTANNFRRVWVAIHLPERGQ